MNLRPRDGPPLATNPIERPNMTTSDADVPNDPPTELITDWIASRFGAFNGEATAALAELVTAVQLIRKPGTITLSFRVEPYSADSMVIDAERIVTITPALKTNLPVATRNKKLQYATPEGALSDRPTNTRPLPLPTEE